METMFLNEIFSKNNVRYQFFYDENLNRETGGTYLHLNSCATQHFKFLAGEGSKSMWGFIERKPRLNELLKFT